MRKLLFVLGVLLIAASASAQTGALVSATVQYYQNGLPLSARTTTLLLSGVPCGQPPFTGAPGTPTITTTAQLVWPDPANAGLNCVAVQPAAATIFLLPISPTSYTATLTVTDDLARTSPPSPASNPFLRAAPLPPPPLAPAVLQVRP